MAEATPDFVVNMERFKALNHSAFITGYSGAVGKILVQELDKLKLFKRVILIGRRELELSVGPEFEQKVIDFEKLDDYTDLFKDVQIGFHCLGTNMSDVGKEMHKKIDFDWSMKIAEMAKSHACKHLVIVTSGTANPNSFTFSNKLKGQKEEEAKKKDFERLTIFQPLALLGGKDEKFIEKAPKVLFKPVFALFPTALSVPRETLVKAMLVDVITPYKEEYKVRVIPNREIHKIAEDFVA